MIQFIKTLDVKDPERNPFENAGIDIFIPNNTDSFRQSLYSKNATLAVSSNSDILDAEEMLNKTTFYSTLGTIAIAPHKDILIPSGIRSKFSPDLALIANNKSGIATKKKLIFGASVIDASYQGEWHLHLINISDEYQYIECGQKVIQFIPHLISTDNIEIIDKTPEEFYLTKSSRGTNWQGSTGLV